MELLPTLLGALPNLGVVGVALVVLVVFRLQQKADTADLREQLAADRAYFSAERVRIRKEAIEDIERARAAAVEDTERIRQAELHIRTLMQDDIGSLRTELRAAEQEVDRLRAQLYPQTPATTHFPDQRRGRHDGGY